MGLEPTFTEVAAQGIANSATHALAEDEGFEPSWPLQPIRLATGANKPLWQSSKQ